MAKKIFILFIVLVVGGIIINNVRVEVTNTVWEKKMDLLVKAGQMNYLPVQFVIPRAVEFTLSTHSDKGGVFVVLTTEQFEIFHKSGIPPQASDSICRERFSGTLHKIIGPLKEGKYYAVIGNDSNDVLPVSIISRVLNKYEKK